MNLVGGVNTWVVGGLLAFLGIFAGAVLLLGWVADARRGPIAAARAEEDECAWCRKPEPGERLRYAIPQDCTCTELCDVLWCQRYPAGATR